MVGPATANIIGKIANGIADDLLSTIITAVTSPVIIAPAMNVNMYNNEIIQENIAYLQEKGYEVLTPSDGMLACGYTGKGRLPEPEVLTEYILKGLTEKDLTDKKILVTAGPTQESLDPVRYLTNYSSGKMGYALAKRASYRGAEVKLISGPTNLDPPLEVTFESIESADDLYEAVIHEYEDYDMIIMAAAVADFSPESISEDKIKKNTEDYFMLELKKTRDILKSISQDKKEGQTIVGFAAESRDLVENAKAKMKRKNMDMIVANDIKNKNIFGSDESEVIIMTKDEQIDVSRSSKEDIADKIFDLLI
jgi:phosphopantothenoylcysteine decarboxylase/phosphopantothenate--cysteine ligase